MKHLRPSPLAALLLAGGLLAGAAQADPLIFDSAGNATFSAQHAGAGSYVDEFLFAVDPELMGWASGTAAVGKTWINPNRLANYGISDITFFRVNLDNSRTKLLSVFNGGAAIEFYPADPLVAGNYGFSVSGATTLAGRGGSYAGNLNLVTAPVPEPAGFLMLSIGLGLLGLCARGKADNKVG